MCIFMIRINWTLLRTIAKRGPHYTTTCVYVAGGVNKKKKVLAYYLDMRNISVSLPWIVCMGASQTVCCNRCNFLVLHKENTLLLWRSYNDNIFYRAMARDWIRRNFFLLLINHARVKLDKPKYLCIFNRLKGAWDTVVFEKREILFIFRGRAAMSFL